MWLLGSRPGQKSQDVADGLISTGGVGEHQVDLDLIVVAATILGLHHEACADEIVHDAGGAALGDGKAAGDVAQPRLRITEEKKQHAAVRRQKRPTQLVFPIFPERSCLYRYT